MTVAPRPLALVTGASGGIGREIALLLAADGYDLLATGRDAVALNGLANEVSQRCGSATRVVAADLSRPEGVKAVVAAVAADGRAPAFLVNNAGLGAAGAFASQPWEVQRDMIAVNVTALTELTRALLPAMLAAGSGHVLNVASTAAFLPGPLMATYYASKAYVLSLSEALAEELRGSGITVTALCPGPTRTAFARRAGAEARRLYAGGLLPQLEAARVARAGIEGARRGRAIVVPGALHGTMPVLLRLVPRALIRRLMHILQQPR